MFSERDLENRRYYSEYLKIIYEEENPVVRTGYERSLDSRVEKSNVKVRVRHRREEYLSEHVRKGPRERSGASRRCSFLHNEGPTSHWMDISVLDEDLAFGGSCFTCDSKDRVLRICNFVCRGEGDSTIGASIPWIRVNSKLLPPHAVGDRLKVVKTAEPVWRWNNHCDGGNVLVS